MNLFLRFYAMKTVYRFHIQHLQISDTSILTRLLLTSRSLCPYPLITHISPVPARVFFRQQRTGKVLLKLIHVPSSGFCFYSCPGFRQKCIALMMNSCMNYKNICPAMRKQSVTLPERICTAI